MRVGGLCSFEVTMHGKHGGSLKLLVVEIHIPSCLYDEGFDTGQSSVARA